MRKSLAFLTVLTLVIQVNGQTKLNFEVGLTQYQDHVEDPGGIFRNSSYFSENFAISITQHVADRISLEPGLQWRGSKTGRKAILLVDGTSVISESKSHGAANHVFLRVNYDILKVEEITIVPGLAYHRASERKAPRAFSTESLTVNDVTLESVNTFTGKSSYGVLELGVSFESRLGESVSLGGFYRHHFLSENQSELVTYTVTGAPEAQARIFRPTQYRYLGFILSFTILKKKS